MGRKNKKPEGQWKDFGCDFINPGDGVTKKIPETEASGMDSRILSVKGNGIVSVPLPLGSGKSVGGIVVGSTHDEVFVDTSERHTVVWGCTGSGKSCCVSIPTILSSARAGHHMIISDMKEELYYKTSGELESLGYQIYRIDLRNPYTSQSWNPLLEAYRLYKSGDVVLMDEAKQYILDLASIMVPISNHNDPYWEGACRDLLQGLCITLFENCEDEGQLNMRSLVRLKTSMMDSSTFEEYYDNLDGDCTEHMILSGIYRNAETTRRCIYSMFDRYMAPFILLDSLVSTTAYSDLDIGKIGVEGKIAVYLTVPDETDSRDSIVSLFISQVAMNLARNAQSYENQRLPKSVLFVLDEFAAFPKMPVIPRMLSTARSRGMRFLLILQGLGQLKDRYGDELTESILSNCDNMLYLHSRELPLLNRISELAGNDPSGRPLLPISRLQNMDSKSREAVLFAGRCPPTITRFTDIGDLSKFGCSARPECMELRSFETMDPEQSLVNRRRKEDQFVGSILNTFDF